MAYHGRWKIGLSVNGCYRCFVKNDYGYATFIFDFQTVKDRVKPALYFPLKQYTWYEFNDYMVTWHNLAWEAELCMPRGNSIRVQEARAVVLKTRRKKLLELIRQSGLEHLTSLPYSPMHNWAKRHLNYSRLAERQRIILADEYNRWVAEWFNLDYEMIKAKLPQFIEKKETERLGNTCRTCKHFNFNYDLRRGIVQRKCLLSGRDVDFRDGCENFEFAIEKFYRKP